MLRLRREGRNPLRLGSEGVLRLPLNLPLRPLARTSLAAGLELGVRHLRRVVCSEGARPGVGCSGRPNLQRTSNPLRLLRVGCSANRLKLILPVKVNRAEGCLAGLLNRVSSVRPLLLLPLPLPLLLLQVVCSETQRLAVNEEPRTMGTLRDLKLVLLVEDCLAGSGVREDSVLRRRKRIRLRHLHKHLLRRRLVGLVSEQSLLSPQRRESVVLSDLKDIRENPD